MAYDAEGIMMRTASPNYTHYATIVYLEPAVNVGIEVPKEALLPAVIWFSGPAMAWSPFSFSISFRIFKS